MVSDTNLPLTIQTSVNFCNFAEQYIFAHFRHIAIKLANFTNTFYSNLSSGVNENFPNRDPVIYLSISKVEKTVKGNGVNTSQQVKISIKNCQSRDCNKTHHQ